MRRVPVPGPNEHVAVADDRRLHDPRHIFSRPGMMPEFPPAGRLECRKAGVGGQ